MVAHQCPFAVIHDQIEAFAGVGAVADDVAQAADTFDTPVFDIRKDDLQRIHIAMDIRDQREATKSTGGIIGGCGFGLRLGR